MQFPSPESVAPEIGVDCWIAHVTGPVRFQWTNFDIDNQILKAGFVHLNEKASEQHSAALCADNLQAVENAR